jgi:endonuclease G
MFTHYLDLDTLHKLMECIVNSQMNTEVVRAELLTTIHPGFVAQLPGQGNPTEKIRGDLTTMNTVPYLENYEVPLRLWLQNALYRLRSSFRPERVYFEQVLEDVTAQSQALIQETQGQSRDVGTLDSLERIVHKDDMLTFSWLEGGLMVGKSVARLVVLRYDNGTVAGSQYSGTGWLLGPQHLITNHHVINARADGEQDASEIDLRLQATHMQVQFDYNSQGMTGEQAAVAELCAWVTRHNDPALDYAVVKLSEASTRMPLTLAPNALDELAKHQQPVNIIQHLGGQPNRAGTGCSDSVHD